MTNVNQINETSTLLEFDLVERGSVIFNIKFDAFPSGRILPQTITYEGYSLDIPDLVRRNKVLYKSMEAAMKGHAAGHFYELRQSEFKKAKPTKKRWEEILNNVNSLQD